MGSKTAWIPSRDGLKTVGVGAKATANTALDSKRASRTMDKKRRAQNDMVTAGMECQKTCVGQPLRKPSGVKDRLNKK